MWRWQYLLAVLLLATNIDWVVIPFLRSNGVRGYLLFFLVWPLANLKLTGWFYFWGWFGRFAVPEFVSKKIKENKEIQEGVNLGKAIKQELKNLGYLDRLKNILLKLYIKATDPEGSFLKKIKRGGLIALFLCGAEPYSLGRSFSAVICGTSNWRKGLYILMAGNTVHVAYMVGLWNLINFSSIQQWFSDFF